MFDFAQAAEAKKRKRDEEERLEALEAERAMKRPRHHDLDLNALAQDDLTSEEMEALRSLFGGPTNAISSPSKKASSSPTKSPAKSKTKQRDDDDDDDKKVDAGISALRKELSPMVVRSRAKVTQDRIYSMAYHPEVTKDLVFCGDKHGQLGIWDALAPPEINDDDEEDEVDDAEGGKYYRLQPHWPKSSKSSISCVKFSPNDRLNVSHLDAFPRMFKANRWRIDCSIVRFSLLPTTARSVVHHSKRTCRRSFSRSLRQGFLSIRST